MLDIYDKIKETRKSGKQFMLITVVEKTGEGPQTAGAKMLITPNGKRHGTVGGGAIEQTAYEKALQLMSTKKSLLQKYDLTENCIHEDAQNTDMVCGGSVTLFYEYVNNLTHVYVFGAGHVGRAVIDFLKYLDYNITVIDHREGIFDNFNGAHETVSGKYNQLIKSLNIERGSFVLIATNSHKYDYEVLRCIYNSGYKPDYIGLLSSRKKYEGFLKQLKEDFKDQLDYSSLFAPVGLDIGGTMPHEIAVSIISEMQTVKYGKSDHNHMRAIW